MSNKWVEVEAKTIDDAIKAGLKELSLEDATQANINILREPEGGVFGVGGTKALVRISVRNGAQSNNRNGNSRGGNSRNYSQNKRTSKTPLSVGFDRTKDSNVVVVDEAASVNHSLQFW